MTGRAATNRRRARTVSVATLTGPYQPASPGPGGSASVRLANISGDVRSISQMLLLADIVRNLIAVNEWAPQWSHQPTAVFTRGRVLSSLIPLLKTGPVQPGALRGTPGTNPPPPARPPRSARARRRACKGRAGPRSPAAGGPAPATCRRRSRTTGRATGPVRPPGP